jgi:DNA replication initiation complex subunit (GINS family)
MGDEQFSKGKEESAHDAHEVAITYETLFEILRREKNRDELQELHKTFFEDVVSYLQGKMTILNNPQSELFGYDEREKTLILVQNIKKLIRDLYDRREKKIINMAINKARTKSSIINTSTLLNEEKSFFDSLCTTLERYRVDVLSNILDTRMPSVQGMVNSISQPATPASSTNDGRNWQNGPSDALNSTVEAINKGNDSQSISENTTEKGQALNISSKEQEIGVERQRNLNVRFLQAVPRFAGPGMEIYGPFEEGDTASVPEEIAKVLISRGKSESCAN